MKKKICIIIISIISVLCLAFCAVGCGGGSSGKGGTDGNGGSENPPAQDDQILQFEGVTLADLTVTYDGKSHSLAVSGDFPEDTTVTYNNNGKTNAGEYKVTATLDKEGYATKTLSAKLIINKAEFAGIELNDATYVHTDSVRSLAVSGELPEGTNVEYKNNGKKDVGEYKVTATLTNPNYNTKTLTAKLIIKSIPLIALDVINALLDKPDPWHFLPSALTPENMAYNQTPVGGLEGFASSVRVSQIEKKSIGKQFNVLYDGLTDAELAINKIDGLFTIGATIAEVYQTFINDNPDNYTMFVKEIGGFKIKIVLDGENSLLLAGNSTVSMELTYNGESGERTGRVQITDGITLKYTASENALKLAVKTTINDVGNIKQIEFVRKNDAVAGYLREFTGTEAKNLKTSGVISSNNSITVIMSDKRETEDMKITGYEEVYSSTTGEYLGGRVKETIKIVDYDTLWLHLSDVTGFESVRVADEKNELNIDSIFINGQNTVFKTKKVNPIIPTSSRRFDVEMKDVWYIVAQTVDGETKYKKIKTSIPMLFVQTEQTDDFPSDVTTANTYMSGVALPVDKINTVKTHYDAMAQTFESVKTEVMYADIQTYIGDKNAFFDSAT